MFLILCIAGNKKTTKQVPDEEERRLLMLSNVKPMLVPWKMRKELEEEKRGKEMSCWPTIGFQFFFGPMITHLSPPQPTL